MAGHPERRAPLESKVSSESPDPNGVFINVPFDAEYEPLFVTLIGVLVFLGQEPHCVLEVREKGDGRLARILDLMRRCRISIHDLSRVSAPVRFNMPFELGLACALKLLHPTEYEVLVLDSKAYRLDKALSDYKGRDPLIHDGTSEGLLSCLMDAFDSTNTPSVRDLRKGLRVLTSAVRFLKRDVRSKSLFRPSVFRSLAALAKDVAIDLEFIRP
jgi:hypothetical protein